MNIIIYDLYVIFALLWLQRIIIASSVNSVRNAEVYTRNEDNPEVYTY